MCPPIEKMDSSLGGLKACRHLALSTNNIDKIGSLGGLEKLEILSLGRNCLKKLENLDAIAGTLRELWLSYNQIDRLVRAAPCSALGGARRARWAACRPGRASSGHCWGQATGTACDCRALATALAGGHREVRQPAGALYLQQQAQGLGRAGAAGGALGVGGAAAGTHMHARVCAARRMRGVCAQPTAAGPSALCAPWLRTPRQAHCAQRILGGTSGRWATRFTTTSRTTTRFKSTGWRWAASQNVWAQAWWARASVAAVTRRP